ncbi:MAG: hydroxymethylglutaryl-CoA lyase [Phycisphaerales bacterium]
MTLERVRITDVAPRDGLQNESAIIPTADKVRLVELLSTSGVDEIEVSSFVSAKWVPQLGDATDVFARLGAWAGAGPLYSALVPNEQGMGAALSVNERAGRKLIGKVGVFTAASETFAKKNINATIAESIRRFEPVVAAAHGAGLAVRGYISCAIRCPFEGEIAPGKVGSVAQALCDLGVDEIDLGDTIGAGEPETINLMLGGVTSRLGGAILARLTLHLHDTFGRAAECVREALRLGVRSFDGSVAGLGGCPYASTPGQRAPGNISTEVLVRTIHGAGYETGVDLDRLGEAAAFASRIVAAARASAPGAKP